MKGFAIKVSVESRHFINPMQPGKDIDFHRDAHTKLPLGLIHSLYRNINMLHVQLYERLHPLPICFPPWTHCCGPPGRCECKATHGDKQLCAFATVVWLCQLSKQAWLQAVGLKPEHLERTHTGMGRTCKLPTERQIEPLTSSLWGPRARLPPTYMHTYSTQMRT